MKAKVWSIVENDLPRLKKMVELILLAINYAVIIQSAVRLKKNDPTVYSFVPSLF